MSIKYISGFIALCVAVSLLSGCVTAAILGGAAATTAVVAHDQRTTGTLIDDQTIELKIKHEIESYEQLNLDANAHLVIVSYNNIVLLAGQVPSNAAKEKIAELAGNVEKVRKVYNEIEVAPPSSLATRSNDSWITTKIKTSSGFNEIDPLRTKVITENGVVYLMGLVTRAQAEQLTELARTTRGVERVVRVFEYVD